MTIAAEIQSLSPSAIIELFTLDMSIHDQPAKHFHAGTNGLEQAIVWGGVTHTPLPVEASGFDITSKGTLPRPKFLLANVGGLFSADVDLYDDLVGCKVIRQRTFARYLDAINFPGNVNPDADPNQKLPTDLWFVERKVSENRHIIEWELSSAFDLMGVMLPYRQVIQNSCPWRYRGAECGYVGTSYFDKANNVVGTLAADTCAKQLSSCKLRFGDAVLPFGGFPGAVRQK